MIVCTIKIIPFIKQLIVQTMNIQVCDSRDIVFPIFVVFDSAQASNHFTRVNYYSSDTAMFNGMATGTPTTDNHRVLELTGSRNAAVGDESSQCSKPSN